MGYMDENYDPVSCIFGLCCWRWGVKDHSRGVEGTQVSLFVLTDPSRLVSSFCFPCDVKGQEILWLTLAPSVPLFELAKASLP